MHIQHLHDWNLSPTDAIALQKQLANRLIYDRPLDLKTIKLVAGVDVSVRDSISQAAVVVATYPDLHIVETALAQRPTSYSYIAGLLSFREGPVLEDAFARLKHEPDVFIFDGMGRAHPRRIGIASHMGLFLGKPTIGCGKTHLLGEYVEPPADRGAWTELVHNGEVIGAILRTRPRTKPVYISVGHLADLSSAIALTMGCTLKFRLPEPIRMAHHAAGQFSQ
jgi:deoxyribonuclease V